MYNRYDSNPIVTNCTFSSNSALAYGGGMYNYYYSSPTVTNCTFSSNTALEGGGVHSEYDSNPTVTNCILWGNTPQEVYNYDESSSPVIKYSDIQGGWEGEGHNNIDINPNFVDSENGDLHLSSDSPCIDAGDPNYALDSNYPTDLDGNPRIVCGRIDMGAYEMADPVVLLDFLYQDIIDLELKQGTENSLLAKLDTALQKLEDDNENNDGAAINVLEAFINTVDAKRGRMIPEEDADYFITAAQEIIDLLSND